MTCCGGKSNNFSSLNNGTPVNDCGCSTNETVSTNQTVRYLRKYLLNVDNGSFGVNSCVFTTSERESLSIFLDEIIQFLALEGVTDLGGGSFRRLFVLIMNTVHIKPEFLDALDYFVAGREPMTPDTRPDVATILGDPALEELYARAFLFFGFMHNRRRHGTNGVAVEFFFSHDYIRYAGVPEPSPILDAIRKISTGTGNLCNNTLVLLSEPAYLLNGNMNAINPENMLPDSCRDIQGPAMVPAGIYIAQSVRQNAFNGFNPRGDELLQGRITLLNVAHDNWITAMIASRIGLLDDQHWKYTLPTDFFDRCGLEDRAMLMGNLSKRAGYLFNPDLPGSHDDGNDSDVEEDSCGNWSVPTRTVSRPSCSVPASSSSGRRAIRDLNVQVASQTLPKNFLGDKESDCIEIEKRVPRSGTILGILGYLATSTERLMAISNRMYLNSVGINNDC